MKSLAALLLIAMIIPGAAVAATKRATKSETSRAVFIDKNCSDFATQKEAQKFFIAQGGPRIDPHRLDADHDGIACEKLKKGR